MNFFPNQIIRNRPGKDGTFKIYRVKGYALDMLEVREVNPKTGEELLQETEFWNPEHVQLYQITFEQRIISIDDVVLCKGLRGRQRIRGFFESKDRILAIVTDKNNLVRPLPLQLVKKST